MSKSFLISILTVALFLLGCLFFAPTTTFADEAKAAEEAGTEDEGTGNAEKEKDGEKKDMPADKAAVEGDNNDAEQPDKDPAEDITDGDTDAQEAPAEASTEGQDNRMDLRVGPRPEYSLEVDGMTLPIIPGEAATLNLAGEEKAVLLRVNPNLTFRYAGFSFQYPASYNYSFEDRSPGTRQWKFTGKNNILLIFEYPQAMPTRKLLKSFVRQVETNYGEGEVKVGDSSLVLGGQELEGKRLEINVAGQDIVQEAYAFSLERNTFMMIIQATPQPEEKASSDSTGLVELIGNTWVWPETAE